MKHTICYISKAKDNLSFFDLEELFETSKNKNDHANIHGVLAYVDNKFFQILEGDKNTITALYNTIQQDNRHTTVEELLNAPTQEYHFEKYKSGFSITQNKDVLYSLMNYLTQLETANMTQYNKAATMLSRIILTQDIA